MTKTARTILIAVTVLNAHHRNIVLLLYRQIFRTQAGET